jgi:hypothetical protein
MDVVQLLSPSCHLGIPPCGAGRSDAIAAGRGLGVLLRIITLPETDAPLRALRAGLSLRESLEIRKPAKKQDSKTARRGGNAEVQTFLSDSRTELNSLLLRLSGLFGNVPNPLNHAEQSVAALGTEVPF